MDSLTQLTLGAAVGEAVLGRKLGNKAILWGAIAGTLPDLDVFVPLGDAVKDFTYHRSASHSLIMLAILTPIMVWLIVKIHPQTRALYWRWIILIYACFASHVILDAMTAYGTQMLWPLVTTPFSWATIFIIDPLYSIPLMIGVIAALVVSRRNDRGHLINRLGLVVSTLYLGWAFAASQIASANFSHALKLQRIQYDQLFVTPTPFNSILWRAVVMDGDLYYEAYYSLLDDGIENLPFVEYQSKLNLLEGIQDEWSVRRLRWFTGGFYTVVQVDNDIVIRDLRMGVEPDYIFQFKVAEFDDAIIVPVLPERVQPDIRLERLYYFWLRIRDESIDLRPLNPAPDYK